MDRPWSSTEQWLGRKIADIGSGRVDKTARFLSHSLFASCGQVQTSSASYGFWAQSLCVQLAKKDLPVQASMCEHHDEAVFCRDLLY